MKLTSGALVVLVVATLTDGFSISMSSYLDNLSSGTIQLRSFAGTTYAPAPAAPSYKAPAPSYAAPPAPAPAPAYKPYKSVFADMPANSDLNYMNALGAGNGKMKSGPNYAGVNRSFRPTRSQGNAAYLDNLKGAVLFNGYAAPQANGYANGHSAPQRFAPAPAPAAPYQSSFAPAPTPAYKSSFAPAPSMFSSRKSYMPSPTNKGGTGIGIGRSYLDGL